MEQSDFDFIKKGARLRIQHDGYTLKDDPRKAEVINLIRNHIDAWLEDELKALADDKQDFYLCLHLEAGNVTKVQNIIQKWQET